MKGKEWKKRKGKAREGKWIEKEKENTAFLLLEKEKTV